MRIRVLFRFSLRTLLLGVLTVVCAAAMWHNREPWFLAHEHAKSVEDSWVFISPDGEEVGVIGNSAQGRQQVSTWSVKTGAHSVSPSPLPADVRIRLMSPDGQVALTHDKEKRAVLWELGRPDPVSSIPAFDGGWGVGWSGMSVGGRRVAQICPDRIVRLFDRETGSTRILGGVGECFTLLDFLGGGRWLVVTEFPSSSNESAGDSLTKCKFRLYDCDRAIEITPPSDRNLVPEDYRDRPRANLFDRYVYVANRRWNVETGKVDALSGSLCDDTAFFRKPNFQVLRTTPEQVEVWSVDLSERVGTLQVPERRISKYYEEVLLSPDGTRLIAPNWGEMGNVVWDVRSGRPLTRIPFKALTGHLSFIDDDHLMSVSGNAIRIWHRRRPESEWGVLVQSEFYMLVLCAVGLLWSIWSDVRRLRSAA